MKHKPWSWIKNNPWWKNNIGKTDKRSENCSTCKNSDDEFSGECYECVKNIQNHYEPKESEE